MFKKIYVEITNICNLNCSFCPPKSLKNEIMSLLLFEKINQEAKNYTKELAYHIVGDALVLSNLSEYLDISLKYNLKVNLTTSANELNEQNFNNLTHLAIKQINFSINSFNANSHKKSLDEYLKPILEFCNFALKKERTFFINLRVWNFDEEKSAKEFNLKLFDKLNKYFNINLNIDEIYKLKPKNLRVANKIFINFDEYFKWPNINDKIISNSGFCYGLNSHFGILANGDVVPCCLDKDGIINLGNVKNSTLSEILNSKRVKEIQNGFKNSILIEPLCQRCTYKERFAITK